MSSTVFCYSIICDLYTLFRTRTGVVPSLASRATHAAWPSDNVQEPGHSSRMVDAEPSRSDQGTNRLKFPRSFFLGEKETFFHISNFMFSVSDSWRPISCYQSLSWAMLPNFILSLCAFFFLLFFQLLIQIVVGRNRDRTRKQNMEVKGKCLSTLNIVTK